MGELPWFPNEWQTSIMHHRTVSFPASERLQEPVAGRQSCERRGAKGRLNRKRGAIVRRSSAARPSRARSLHGLRWPTG